MSNNPNDKDDWSQGSASLFREARRAHDPTPLESARLDAILARIQAGNPEASLKAKQVSEVAVRGTAAMLRQIAKLSLAVLCVAAVAITFLRASRQPSEPARSAQSTPSADASSPTLAAAPSNAAASGLPRTSEAQDERESRPRSPRRRSRANAQVQQASRMDAVAATEAPSLAPEVAPVRVTAPASGSSTAGPAAATSQSAARPTSSESNPQAAVVAPTGRDAEPPPQPPPSELSLLKRMHVALREADYGAVMALCAEHERRWPHGVFEFEREGVRAIAACAANSDDAIPRAQRFLATHPHTPIAMRVSSACVARRR